MSTFKYVDRVRMSLSGSAGTGPLTLNLPGAGFQSFTDAGMSFGDQTSYVIEDGTPLGSIWELGKGTVQSNGTFTRDVIYQSSLGGTTPISATASAVLSASFLAQDMAPQNPTVVQTKCAILTGSGAQTLTLDAAPTDGNFLVGFKRYGNADASGRNFWDPTWSRVISDGIDGGIAFMYAFSGISATINIGNGNGSDYVVGVFEISGLDFSLVRAFDYDIEHSASTTSLFVYTSLHSDCRMIGALMGDNASWLFDHSHIIQFASSGSHSITLFDTLPAGKGNEAFDTIHGTTADKTAAIITLIPPR